ncbi:acyl carrier protein [Clostridia bacterium]|nr:acyl carrier protein [Clostridia bacterium]
MYNKIKDMLMQKTGLGASQITPEAKLIADLKLDSLDVADFVFECESEFGIQIPDDELKKLYTVADIAAFVEEKTGEL